MRLHFACAVFTEWQKHNGRWLLFILPLISMMFVWLDGYATESPAHKRMIVMQMRWRSQTSCWLRASCQQFHCFATVNVLLLSASCKTRLISISKNLPTIRYFVDLSIDYVVGNGEIALKSEKRSHFTRSTRLKRVNCCNLCVSSDLATT